ncbi:MAG: hypothetical protein K0S88_5895 [Actinomycetia bacterium]|jgi:hypothetical protein|nr:hypothetical protein [Actinomycetes bacterium]
MSGWLRAVLLAVALAAGTWALLVLLARRLPPGLLRDLAGFVPDCVTTVRRLRRDPRVPRRAKVAVALRYAARQVPRHVLVAAWPGGPRVLERLLGSPAPTTD